MNKPEVVDALVTRTGLNKDDVRRVLDHLMALVTEQLSQGEPVRLVGFGSFLVQRRAAGVARNPRSGEVKAKPASNAARFRPGDTLKRALNEKPPLVKR